MTEYTQIEMDVLFIVIGWVVIVLGLMVFYTSGKQQHKIRYQFNLGRTKNKSTIKPTPVSHKTR
jgi:uncharacterized membrane protein